MGLQTNFTITGQNYNIKTPFGDYFDTGGIALVQWEKGYDPALHPLQEWVMNPVNVSWTGWYVKDYQGVGKGVFGSNGMPTNFDSPIYLFVDFYNSSNWNPSMSGQVWMGQVTGDLNLDGGSQELQLNASNIRSVVGYDDGFGGLYSQDFNTWTPQSVPEPSYTVGALALFVVAVVHRFKSKKKVAQ